MKKWRFVSIGMMLFGFVLLVGGATFGSAEAQVTNCAADNLGEAEDYTVFACGDVNHNGADSEGRVAVGGNLTNINAFSPYTVCGVAPITGDLATGLVVDGDLISLGGGFNINNGCSAVVGGSTATAGTINFNGGGTLTDGVGAGNTGVNFASACGAGGSLESANTLMLGFADSTGMNFTNNTFGALTISADPGTSNTSNTYYVNITATDLASFPSINMTVDATNLPADATVVVNVQGSGVLDLSAGSFNFSLIGIDRTRVLWNWDPDIGPISLNASSWQGTFFAPAADLTLTNGNMEGQTIVNSFTAAAAAETHEYPFAGCILTPSAITLGDISVSGSSAPMMVADVQCRRVGAGAPRIRTRP